MSLAVDDFTTYSQCSTIGIFASRTMVHVWDTSVAALKALLSCLSSQQPQMPNHDETGEEHLMTVVMISMGTGHWPL